MGFQQSGPGLESFWPTASPLCVPGTKVSPRVSVKYIMLIFICCYQLMVWSRLWKSWAPPQENDSAPTLAFSVPPLSGLSWQHWRHWGTVLCTHNPTSLKLMQSPLKSHLCSFSTGKDQRLTCAQRLSEHWIKCFVTVRAAAGTGRVTWEHPCGPVQFSF